MKIKFIFRVVVRQENARKPLRSSDLSRFNLGAKMRARRRSISRRGFTRGRILLFTESSGVHSQRGQKHDGVAMLTTSNRPQSAPGKSRGHVFLFLVHDPRVFFASLPPLSLSLFTSRRFPSATIFRRESATIRSSSNCMLKV